MRLVRFGNGTYGVEYNRIFYKVYQDFSLMSCKWTMRSPYFRDCMVSEGVARAFIAERTQKVERI